MTTKSAPLEQKAALEEERLYTDRVRVYPQSVSGRFRRLKWAALIALLGIYYIVPWIRWDRGPGAPDQAVLIDMPGRRAYFFFVEIWPQEVYYLTGLLIAAAVGLFLATALFGRVWCGFACPQTVWTDLFMWVERLIQGDRNARIRLDRASWSPEKLWKKAATHAAWLFIAAATGGAWIMYFNDAPTVTREIFTGQAGPGVYFFFGLFTATTYLLAGWAREQVCTYMCPWPRIQGGMLDEDSFVVTYETWRGEPRGHIQPGRSFEGRGHCVDCNKCVNVCPMGIDIRDGQQLECIGCALCVDACDSVMTRLGLPTGLVTYDSLNNQAARAKREPLKTRLFRPRSFVYAGILLAVAAVMAFGLTTRSTLDVNVLRDRAPLFVTLSDGSIRNGYTYKILNKERVANTYHLSVTGIPDLALDVQGERVAGAEAVLDVRPDSVGTFRVYVKVPREWMTAESTPLAFVLTNTRSGEKVTHDTVFLGPGR